jgi:hypothetical protein
LTPNQTPNERKQLTSFDRAIGRYPDRLSRPPFMWHAILRNSWWVTMPIPAFNEYGLLPAGIHDCTTDEVQHFFCFNDVRVQIWMGFGNFLNWIANQPAPDAILVDGTP